MLTDEQNKLFYTAVLSVLRMHGGTFFIAAKDVAEGDFTLNWERTASGGLRVTETTPNRLLTDDARKAMDPVGIAPRRVRKKPVLKYRGRAKVKK
jgi:hypothetical protein